MNNVKIKITTIQVTDDAGNEDVVEFITEATLNKKADYFTIDYDDSRITETEESKTRLKIFKNKLLVSKLGEFSTKMEFEKDKNYKNIYTTPYGSFDVEFNTIVFKNNLDDNGKGNIIIEYNIIFSKSNENYNKIKIEIA